MKTAEFGNIAEIRYREKFLQGLLAVQETNGIGDSVLGSNVIPIPAAVLSTTIDSGLATFLLHCEARIASSIGQGFYTIGPCGEELLGAMAFALRDTDSSALHYRHVATSVARQLMAGRAIEDIILDRARGFTCSLFDPVTGGRHCAIGGHKYEFLVTSTLASQATPAVGRALAIPLSKRLKEKAVFPFDAVSFVTLGDGSVHNSHFLSALNLAKYSQHRGIKCPVVFGVSDNNICISLPGYDWSKVLVRDCGIQSFVADGCNVDEVYWQTKAAIDFSRSVYKPSLLLFKNLPRRFGHAATDRQFAYRTTDVIEQEMNRDPLFETCILAIKRGVFTKDDVIARFRHLQTVTENAFAAASKEPKATSRDDLVNTVSVPLSKDKKMVDIRSINGTSKKKEAMRKHMTRVYDEILANQHESIYIGEDVEHGGYYLVTEGLHEKFGSTRVRNVPPDETALMGVALGMSQSGFKPIVEIPYAKYLDCAADIFAEVVVLCWLSNGKQAAGMLVRLQGFGPGVFGGNFHTHNAINILPGLDVVCYSNGYDYVRGIRYCVRQANAGRVIMSVDSTDLLNKRHLDDGLKDEFMLHEYPIDGEEMKFDDVVVYQLLEGKIKRDVELCDTTSSKCKRICIITYGSGVLEAIMVLKSVSDKNVEVIVIDCPYLTSPPKQLCEVIEGGNFSHLIFADVCKQGSGMPLGGIAIDLQNRKTIKSSWVVIGASPTYNPLGNMTTFLSKQDILSAVKSYLSYYTRALTT